MPALGDEFRSAREARGLTLSDVAEQIHIRSVYLNAIENEDWKSIGAPVYVRGFIRTYARYLGKDAEDAVGRFNQTSPVERPVVASASAATLSDNERSGPSLWAVIATLVAVLLVGFVGYEWWQYAHPGGGASAVARATEAPQPADTGAESQAPAASPRPRATPAASGVAPHQLALRLTQRSWLRVVVDGTQQLEGIFPAGTVRTFKGNVADVRAGNAGGVVVGTNGRSPAPMGNVGDVVEQRFTL
ncbi:MAG TPA: RodZ domain-containing protein [Candidatus Elarobacter sp.]|jgi:transcriptional regulator with XRE-family HTH domain